MLFTPTEGAASAEELERFRYEHPRLVRDPAEYVERGQVFLTLEPGDPAPGWLPDAMGEAGRRIPCFAVDYGHWDATLAGCVGLVTGNRRIDADAARALLWDNAIRFYGSRLEERIAC